MEQTDLLRFVLDALETPSIPYFIVGSFASAIYGEPRFTYDIDVVIDLVETDVHKIVQTFAPPDFYLSADSIRLAIRDRFQFNVLHTESGNKIDFILSRADEWGRSQMARRQRLLVLPDREGFVAAPEDVILGKLLYYTEGQSDKHLRDVLGVLVTQKEKIDRTYLEAWVTRLTLNDAWQAVVDRERAI